MNVLSSATALESSSTGNIAWKQDEGWDKPAVDIKNRGRFNDINLYLYEPGLLCRIYGGDYVFLDTSNCWCNLASPEAVNRILALVDIKNATVNYDSAMRQFYKHITKRCGAKMGQPIPTSVCIGTKRLEINLDPKTDRVEFFECRPLVTISNVSIPAYVRGVCTMPIDITILPASYVFPGEGKILTAIMKLFHDMRSLVTILWTIGNSLVDPIFRPKCVFLCGPGGSGKSTLLHQVFSCVAGCTGILPDGSLVGNAPNMSAEITEVIASSRLAVCFDVDLEHRPLNMSIFKNITGSDYVRVGYTSVKTNCSLILASNGDVDIVKQPEYLTDAIIRRMVCVLMNTNALTIPLELIPEDTASRLDFCCAAIFIRLKYKYIPVSPYDMLLTICQSKIDEALQYVMETDKSTDAITGVGVLAALEKVLDIDADAIVTKVKLISPTCVILCEKKEVLRGLKLRTSSEQVSFS